MRAMPTSKDLQSFLPVLESSSSFAYQMAQNTEDFVILERNLRMFNSLDIVNCIDIHDVSGDASVPVIIV